MDKKAHNPWQWQDQFGFSQGVEFATPSRVLVCAGQTSNDENGVPINAGDILAQTNQCLDNLEQVLAKAGLGLADVVRLNYYTTDVEGFMGAIGAVVERFEQAGATPPASTLLGVAALFHPDIKIEIEATAVA